MAETARDPVTKMQDAIKTALIDAKVAELRHTIAELEKRIKELEDEKPF